MKNYAFTLIELLIVIGIIAILSIVVVLVLNPAQLLMQSRDANRISDMASLNSALGFYLAQGGTSLGTQNTVYISIPDPAATSSFGDQCQGLNLPALPASDTYFCAPSSTYRRIDGSGWIPVNLTTLPGGTPLSQLPIDPLNQSSTGFYYTYANNGSQFILTAIPESSKYKTQYGNSPSIPNYPEVISQGTNLGISPLFSASGLVGYWPLNEGSGTTAVDFSGNGNNGAWSGTPAGTGSTYYGAGKVGTYAAFFNGSDDYIDAGVATPTQIATGDWSFSAWVNTNTNGVLTGRDNGGGTLNSYIQANQLRIINGAQQVSSAYTTPTGQWFFLAVSVTRSSSTITYLNGAVLASQPSLPILGANISPALNLLFGRRVFAGTPFWFGGFLDDIRIYNRALSPAEIQALYNAQK